MRRRRWTRSLLPTGINVIDPAGKHLDVSANIPNSSVSTVTSTLLCCSDRRGFVLPRPYLFPITSLSLCRAWSAASWEENCTNASPDFLPLWFVTMVIPFSTTSKPAQQNKDPEFAVSVSTASERWEKLRGHLRRTGRCRPPCRWRGDLWAARPQFQLEPGRLSLGWLRRRCLSLRTLQTHKSQHICLCWEIVGLESFFLKQRLKADCLKGSLQSYIKTLNVTLTLWKINWVVAVFTCCCSSAPHSLVV